MALDYSIFVRLRRRTPLWVGGMALFMLAIFPLVPPTVAAVFNIALVVVANLLGFWRWGLVATAYTIVITWVMDTLFWHIGFGPETYVVGGLFNLLMTLVFGTVLAAKERQIVTDGLTGLFNASHFRETLAWEVCKSNRYGRKLSLLMIDLDRFKPLNDCHGHPAGDEVLRRFARLLTQVARDCDLAARYGGDEFALILPETDIEGARELAARLKSTVQSIDWEFHGQALDVAVSIGAAEHKPGQVAEDLLAQADHDLYQSKQRGNQNADNSGT